MSQFVRMKSDPRHDKGVCSDCKYLSVRETGTGSSTVLCFRFSDDGSGPLIPIRHKLDVCTDHKSKPRGNFIEEDAWLIDIDAITGEPGIKRGQRRYYKGKFQQQHYINGHYVWKSVKKGGSDE